MGLVRALCLVVTLVAFTLSAGTLLATQAPGSSGVHTPGSPPPQIPAPTGLVVTSDPHVCSAHTGPIAALLCADARSKNTLTLVFNWAGNKAYPTQDSFDVYEVEGGMHKLVDRNTTKATVGFVARPAGLRGFGARCYAVTAAFGKIQSRLSTQVCIPPTLVAPTDLEWTENVATCVAHASSAAIITISKYGTTLHGERKLASCAKAIADKYKILIWDWKTCHAGCVAAVDGFTVSAFRKFEVPFPTTAFAAWEPSVPGTPSGRPCYTIRAHVKIADGTIRESDLSSIYTGCWGL